MYERPSHQMWNRWLKQQRVFWEDSWPGDPSPARAAYHCHCSHFQPPHFFVAPHPLSPITTCSNPLQSPLSLPCTPFSPSHSLPLQSLLAGGARADSVYQHAFHILQNSLRLQQILNPLLSGMSIHVAPQPQFPACVLDSLSCLAPLSDNQVVHKWCDGVLPVGGV